MLAINRYGIYQFRAVVPSDLRTHIGKREIWRSLGTSNKAEALKLEAVASCNLDALLQRIRAIVTPRQPFKQITSLFVDANAGTVKAEGDLTSADMAELSKLVRCLNPKAEIVGSSSSDPTTLFEVYVAEKQAAKAWTEKSEAETRSHFVSFNQFRGDREYTTTLFSDFKATLIAAGKQPATINKCVGSLSGYTKWLYRNGHTPKNFCDGLSVRKAKKQADSDQRKAFEEDDLRAIFAVTDIESGARCWVPKLALYTGCRLEELCQLYVIDVKQIDGIWCLDVNEEADDKDVKSIASKRIVPLHDDICEAFLAYVQSLEKGAGRVFPELKLYRDGYGQSVGKWFGRIIRNKAKIEDRKKVFHSFRHTFSTALKHALVPEEVAGALAGHKNDSITYNRYGKGYPASVLKEAIDKLKFDI